ncbi:Diguanylate cyclase (GGDEF) domain-containing protein [Pseudomonas sp. 8Z]|uniref:sensor domain-containing diguanylate cyclase n=1 Tax=Pseudomonas sp. 8Z TaxID=2653166 RepID=UPI0012F081EB|nr:sensor domain-containing diguanylate cyclase [Pseudomonas sp. 8Z]VXD04609.1 Diguanylate cyclase (GGDEF) domain-containing protein [Pseudomonas sp. 8Z]
MAIRYLSGLQWNLRSLIVILASFIYLITLANSFYASYRVQKQTLIDTTLEANQAYAAKLASSIDIYLRVAQQQLAYNAEQIARKFDNYDELLNESNRLRLQTESFNSVVIVDAQGVVRATSPEALSIRGKHLKTQGALQALQEKRPLISKPYVSSTNRLLIFISQPIVDQNGQYLGYVGGSIYLKEPSILNKLLADHYYRDGSQVYVVDKSERLLFHPQQERIGSTFNDGLSGNQNGSRRLTDEDGLDMLSGFAQVPMAEWEVVAQKPTESSLKGLKYQMRDVIINTVPLALIALLLILWYSKIITRPLHELAQGASKMGELQSDARIGTVNTWYQESAEIQRALMVGVNLLHERIGKLHQDVQTDPMTALYNRRGLEQALTLWETEERPFALLMLDIDHFKRINDTFGHDAGDRVLIWLASLMRDNSRSGDLLCRMGGEEFAMLLPNASVETAQQVAERLREQVANTPIEGIGTITLSIGIALWPEHGNSFKQLFKLADEQLYQAKSSGRNQTRIASKQPQYS